MIAFLVYCAALTGAKALAELAFTVALDLALRGYL